MQPIGQLIGARVRQKRKALGMTQEQLEAISGVLQGSISRIESGIAQDVNASTLIGFAKALHVSADYLLGLDVLEQTTKSGTTEHPKRTKRLSQTSSVSRLHAVLARGDEIGPEGTPIENKGIPGASPLAFSAWE